jgi:hypothetical protein
MSKKKVIAYENVHPKEGGEYSLYCYTCNRWIPNTANYEMKKEGCFAHSHSCSKFEDGSVEIYGEEGIE